METMTSPRLSRGRYIRDASGHIYDTWGKYHISEELWQHYEREGRADWAKHSFAWAPDVRDEDRGAWTGSGIRCQTCGETRIIFGHSPEDLNRTEGWCVPPVSKVRASRLWRFLGAGA